MHATIDHFSGSAFVPDARQLKRVAAGVAVSLALHALVLSIYRQPQPAPPAAPPESLTVRLRPIAPPAPPAPQAVPQESPQTRPPAKPAPAKRARPVIAVPVQTREPGEETQVVAPPPDVPPQQDATPSSAPAAAPSFDMNAARGMARKLANEPDPAKVGTALERLPPKPLETESRLARGIGAAKRANCKDGIPGGLLAPIYLMLEKKDSGCKW
jgi:outer membrane biosynthesis protein TonB